MFTISQIDYMIRQRRWHQQCKPLARIVRDKLSAWQSWHEIDVVLSDPIDAADLVRIMQAIDGGERHIIIGPLVETVGHISKMPKSLNRKAYRVKK